MQGKETIPTVTEGIEALFIVVNDVWQFEGFFVHEEYKAIDAVRKIIVRDGLSQPPAFTIIPIPTFRRWDAG